MHNYYKQMNLDVKQCIYVYVLPKETDSSGNVGDHDVKYTIVNSLTYEQVRQFIECLFKVYQM